MNRPMSLIRRALLTTTALTALTFAGAAWADDKTVTSNEIDTTGGTFDNITINSPFSLTVGDADNNVTLTADLVTTLNDDTTLTVSQGSTYVATGGVTGSNGVNTLNVAGTLNSAGVPINLLGGDDVVNYSGSLFAFPVNMGAGNDTFTFDSSGNLAALPVVDGGDDTDTLILTGTASIALVNSEVLTNFENLVKNGTNTFTLQPSGTYETVTVNSGTLALAGDFEITGNTTTVAAGAALNILDGTTNDAGDALISGTLNVQNPAALDPGIFNVAGTTTVFDGGAVNIDAGATMTISVLDIQAGGTVNVDGTLQGTANADTVMIAGVLDATGVTIDLSDGRDIVTVSGTLLIGTLNLGADADTLTIVDTYSSIVFDSIDGGANTILSDTLEFTGSSSGNSLGGLSSITGFEQLVKRGTSTWSLDSSGVATFETLTVTQGTLVLTGGWSFTRNTTTVDGGATLEIGDGSTATTVDELGNTNIFGTLVVTNNATYNAGDGAGDVTSIGGGTLQIDAGGTFNVAAGSTIVGSANSDTIIMGGSLFAGAGANLGAGDDTFVYLDTASVLSGDIDAGTNTALGDNLILAGEDASSGIVLFLSGVGDTVQFRNFENLIKNGPGQWSLVGANGMTAADGLFQTLTVNDGVLNVQLGATLNIVSGTVNGGIFTVLPGATVNAIGSSMTYNAGTTNIFGLFNEAGDTTVTGTALLWIQAGGIYNAGDDPTDVTTVSGTGELRVGDDGAAAAYTASGVTDVTGGLLSVFGGGTYTGTGDVTVNGGMIVVNTGGTFNALAITRVLSGSLTVNGGIYTTTGATFVQGGVLQVDAGTYQANGNVVVQNNLSQIIVDGGAFNAAQATTVNNNGAILIAGGQYTATGVTNIQLDGTLQVDGGIYQANGNVNVLTGGNILVNPAGTMNAGAATNVSGGIIQVSGNGNYTANGTTTVMGFILVDDTGTYTANDTTTVNGGFLQVEGNGTYNANGATTVNAFVQVSESGTYNANGATTVTGFLQITDSGVYDASGFTIDINAFGNVEGNGFILGTVNNNVGILSPGDGALGNVGTLSLTGTYNQATGGNFQADLQPGGPADRLAITGDAALLGNVQLNTLAANFAPLEQYRIISTSNPIPTIFETASVSGAGIGTNILWVGRVDDAGVFNEADPATGNNVDVIVATAPGALQGLTPNQQAVANYLGNIAVSGGVYIEESAIFLIAQIVGAGPNALDQIGGEIYDSFTTFAFDTARQYGRLVDDRVRMLRCAAKSGAPSPFCAAGTPTLLADTGPDSIATPGIDSPKGFSPNTHPYGWSVWASGLGSFLSKDRTSTNLGYNGWTTGGVMGVDLALRKRWIVGIMVGGSQSNINFSGVGGDGDLSNVGVGVYTAWYGNQWFADASFTYSKNWIEADRELQFGSVNSTATGKTQGDQYAAHATLGYGFSLRGVALELSGGVDWVQLRQYGFTETGAGLLNLTVNSRTDDSLRLRIGVRAAKPFAVRPGFKLVPEIEVGYARELFDNTRPITSSLSPVAGSFTVNGDDGSRNIVTFGAGVKAAWSQGVTLSLNYDGEWAGDRQIHGVTGRVQIRW